MAKVSSINEIVIYYRTEGENVLERSDEKLTVKSTSEKELIILGLGNVKIKVDASALRLAISNALNVG